LYQFVLPEIDGETWSDVYKYQCLWSSFVSWMPPAVQDVIRASSLLILAAVATVWFSGNVIEVYHDLIDSFTPRGMMIPDSIKTGIMIFYDILFHIAPVLILGLPYHVISLFVAYGIMLAWFITARHRLPSIYSSKVSFDRGMVGAIMAIWLGTI
jgi:hypothetical protein